MLLSKLVDLIKSGDSKFIKANIFENIDIENAASLDIALKNQMSIPLLKKGIELDCL